jgi:hypothetical protein
VAHTSERSGKESEAFDDDAMEVVRAASCNAPTRPPSSRDKTPSLSALICRRGSWSSQWSRHGAGYPAPCVLSMSVFVSLTSEAT